MLVSILGKEVELQPEPIGTFPDYSVYETTFGEVVHLDPDGEPIIYNSYMGYRFGIMHTMNAFVKDLGDRIEIQKHVGGMHHWYRYHIDKKTRQAIAYFESWGHSKTDGIDTSMFRVWSSVDLGKYLLVTGGNYTFRLIHRSDGTDVDIRDPDDSVVSDIRSFNKIEGDLIEIRCKKAQFHIDASTMKPIIYSYLETGEKLSYFDRTTVEKNGVWVHKGWRKYLVNPATKTIVNEKLDWVPKVTKFFFRLLTLVLVGCAIFAAYVLSQTPGM